MTKIDLNEMVFVLSTKKKKGKIKIFRLVGMGEVYIYDVDNEQVTIVNEKHKTEIKRNIYEFMEQFGACITQDADFEDVCKFDFIESINWLRSDRCFPNSAKLFDQIYKQKNSFLDLFSSVSMN